MYKKSYWLRTCLIFVLLLLFQNCGKSISTSSQENLSTAQALKLIWTHDLSGSWSNLNQDNSRIHLPIGWGYMDPMIAVKDGNQYAVTINSCESPTNANFGKIYCVYIVMNGNIIISDALSLGNIPGHTISSAYQTPILFLHGNRLHLAYWGQSSNRSVIHITYIPLNGSGTQAWHHAGTYVSPEGTSMNYLGGAVAPDGTLVITSALFDGDNRRLDVLYADVPYSSIQLAGPAASFSSPAFTPLYSHVVVRRDGHIDILTTLNNGEACSETGSIYTAYKNVVQYSGTLSGGFRAVWSDGASDVASSPNTNGDSCLFHNSRFPLDLFHDAPANTSYSIYKAIDLKKINPAARLASNTEKIAKIRVVTSAGLTVIDDLGLYFTQFENSMAIDAVSMTKLATGEFVFIANRRDSLLKNKTNHVNIITTKDFKTFSPVWLYSSPFGAGHSIKVAQPYKNGGDLTSTLDFYHGGDLYNPAGKIGYTQFRFYRLEVSLLAKN